MVRTVAFPNPSRSLTMKYRHEKLATGQWAVVTGKQYFRSTTTDSEHDAEIQALKMSAHWYREQADKAHARLQDLGAICESDPYGYLA